MIYSKQIGVSVKKLISRSRGFVEQCYTFC